MKLPAIVRNTQFLKLWGNQILLQVGMNMCNYTSLLILSDRTHSPFIQAIFYTSLTIPAFLFGLIAGPVVDMTDRKRLMLVTDILMATLFFCYAFAHANIFLIIGIAFLTSTVARFFIPAEAATIPLIVSEETLEHANTFFLFTLMGSVLLGYAIAGPIIQLAGGLGKPSENAPFFIAGIMLIIGFVLRLTLKRIAHVKPHIPDGGLITKTLKLFWETVEEVRDNTSISMPLGLLIFVELMVGMLSIIILEYVHRYLLLPLTSVSYILMIPLIFHF